MIEIMDRYTLTFKHDRVLGATSFPAENPMGVEIILKDGESLIADKIEMLFGSLMAQLKEQNDE